MFGLLRLFGSAGAAWAIPAAIATVLAVLGGFGLWLNSYKNKAYNKGAIDAVHDVKSVADNKLIKNMSIAASVTVRNAQREANRAIADSVGQTAEDCAKQHGDTKEGVKCLNQLNLR